MKRFAELFTELDATTATPAVLRSRLHELVPEYAPR